MVPCRPVLRRSPKDRKDCTETARAICVTFGPIIAPDAIPTDRSRTTEVHGHTDLHGTTGTSPDSRWGDHGHHGRHAHHACHARTRRIAWRAWTHERLRRRKTRTGVKGRRTDRGSITRPAWLSVILFNARTGQARPMFQSKCRACRPPGPCALGRLTPRDFGFVRRGF
jgi:hypothetical protein